MADDNSVQAGSMGELSNRSLTLAYTVALAVVALMTLGSHLTLNRIMKAHEGAATVINASGRQRMLSQRIASLSAQLALGVPGAREDLLKATDQFETAHHDLVYGSEILHLPAAQAPDIRAIYFDGPHPLDPAVAAFVARARRIAALGPGDPARVEDLRRLFAEAREPILTDLDAVVAVHQANSERQLSTLEWLQTGSLLVVLATLVVEALIIFRPMVLRIARYTRALMVMAATDYLTEALNRRSFNERAGAELSRLKRHRRPACVLMLDADRFKAVNDTFGHAAGDAVLKALARSVAAALRPSDLFGRMGGEEFGVLLSETDLAGAVVAAERIRRTVADLRVQSGNATIAFTISIGASQLEAGDETIQAALNRADMALYQAKAQGRNRVVAALRPAGQTPAAHPVRLNLPALTA